MYRMMVDPTLLDLLDLFDLFDLLDILDILDLSLQLLLYMIWCCPADGSLVVALQSRSPIEAQDAAVAGLRSCHAVLQTHHEAGVRINVHDMQQYTV